ncbi:MAG: single-stranded-DNA-specific exonuclease C-terminal domain-containing protein, partial [Streptococcus salivarius]|nr:single-stranded-DNA-specific exonuclease C-terminal domain-containing protein [Streptococcus salivarius]
LSVNVWNGQTTLQLMLEDARVDGVQLFDFRSKNMALPEGLPTVEEAADTEPAVVLNTLPESATELKEWFEGKDFQAIYFKNSIKEAYYLTGYGTREQFARLYKTIYQFPEFDVRYKLDELSNYLKIDKMLLIKMIQILYELYFVTIDNGVMTVNKEAEKREIEDSQIFQNLKRLVKFQELMALGTPQEIYDWLYK